MQSARRRSPTVLKKNLMPGCRPDATPACTPSGRWSRRQFPGVGATADLAIRAPTSARSCEGRPDEQREHQGARGGPADIGGVELPLCPSNTRHHARWSAMPADAFSMDHGTAKMPPTWEMRARRWMVDRCGVKVPSLRYSADHLAVARRFVCRRHETSQPSEVTAACCTVRNPRPLSVPALARPIENR